jgi:hypothetical protein
VNLEDAIEALQAAKEQGQIPFFVMMPVTPEFLERVDHADRIIGEAAGQKMAREVRAYQGRRA